MTESQLKEYLNSFSSYYLGKYPHRYLVFDLNNKNNLGLKDFLSNEGYWLFNPNKSKHLVYFHQIAAFFSKGKYLPHEYGDFVEVHHINGNTHDNSWNNLIYLTPSEHHIVTKFQRKLSKIKLKFFFKLNHSNILKSIYNKQNKLIKNWSKFIISIICSSVVKSNQWFNNLREHQNKLKPIKYIVSQINHFIKKFNPTLINPIVFNHLYQNP
jgi:hypothetical protein